MRHDVSDTTSLLSAEYVIFIVIAKMVRVDDCHTGIAMSTEWCWRVESRDDAKTISWDIRTPTGEIVESRYCRDQNHEMVRIIFDQIHMKCKHCDATDCQLPCP